MAGSQPDRLDVRVGGTVRVAAPRDPCHLWTSVEQIARQAGFVAGFESERRCVPAPTTRVAGDDALVFDGATPRQMLDVLVDRVPGSGWDVRDGVVVVRAVANGHADTALDRSVA